MPDGVSPDIGQIYSNESDKNASLKWSRNALVRQIQNRRPNTAFLSGLGAIGAIASGVLPSGHMDIDKYHDNSIPVSSSDNWVKVQSKITGATTTTYDNGLTIESKGKSVPPGSLVEINKGYENQAIDTVFKNLTPETEPQVKAKVEEMINLLAGYMTQDDYERVLQYEDLIDKVAKEHNYPTDTALGLVLIESRGHTSGDEAVSKAGANGAWQLMPGTATEAGLIVDPDSGVDQREDIELSTNVAISYLDDMRNKTFKNTGLEVVAYNWGWGNVINASELAMAATGKPFSELSIQDVVDANPDMPKEAKEYAYKAAAAIELLKEYKLGRTTVTDNPTQDVINDVTAKFNILKGDN